MLECYRHWVCAYGHGAAVEAEETWLCGYAVTVRVSSRWMQAEKADYNGKPSTTMAGLEEKWSSTTAKILRISAVDAS